MPSCTWSVSGEMEASEANILGQCWEKSNISRGHSKLDKKKPKSTYRNVELVQSRNVQIIALLNILTLRYCHNIDVLWQH